MQPRQVGSLLLYNSPISDVFMLESLIDFDGLVSMLLLSQMNPRSVPGAYRLQV